MPKFYEIDVADVATIDDLIDEMRSYYEQPYQVYCDICDAEDYAPEATLKQMGWYLGGGQEICPNHD